MNKKLQKPKGTRDLMGKTYEQRKAFLTFAENKAEGYGFSGIETPIFEHTEVFLKGVGKETDIVSKEMYRFTTAGGDDLTLRPEGTASVMRSYIENGMISDAQPKRFYYDGFYFRHEKPQKGRYRQFTQFGVEVMGAKNPAYDALVIQLGYDILKKGIPHIIVEINELGTQEERATYLSVLQNYYEKHKEKLPEEEKRRIETNPLRILDSKDEQTKRINEHAPKLEAYLSEESKRYFEKVVEMLDTLSISYRIKPQLVRGIDYYEHTVFEYKLDDGETDIAFGGGGRYDGLAEILGYHESIPSIGMALGVERAIEWSEDEAYTQGEKEKIYVCAEEEYLFPKILTLLRKNKKEGISFYPEFSIRKMKKHLERAEKLGFSTLILIKDENEIEKRNLKTRESRIYPIEAYLND